MDPRRPGLEHHEAGQVNAIAVDPSDPSGNTVYVGGASGGIWKTTDFLTTSPNGPTWIPLTNFGPSAAVNIGSITIFPSEPGSQPVDHHRRHRRRQQRPESRRMPWASVS